MTPIEVTQAAKQRSQVTRPGQIHAQHVLARAGEQPALGHQHRRKEDQQQDLGELGRLNREARQPNPDLGAVLLGQRPRQQRRYRQEDKSGQPADVAVARELAVVLQRDHHESEGAHADQRPQNLRVGDGAATPLGQPLVEVESMNHHQPQPVEQRHDRQQQRVRVRRVASDRQVRDDEHRQESRRVVDQCPAEAALLVGLHNRESRRRDHGGEAQQQQLGITPVRQCGRDGDRRLRLRAHSGVRQLVPG